MSDIPWARNITREQWTEMVAKRDARIKAHEGFVASARHALVLLDDNFLDEGRAQIRASLVHLEKLLLREPEQK